MPSSSAVVVDPQCTHQSWPAEEASASKRQDPLAAHVVLEGNICAGKSTLCALLQKELAGSTEVRIQSELTEENFLTAFYGNMKKYGFAFQMFMFSSRVYQVEEGARLARAKQGLVLTDRGVLGDWCFARKNHIDGNMTDEEYAIYEDVANKRALCELPDKVDCTIYLDVDPEQCAWRMRHLRKTAAEQGVLQEYMTGIDDCYFDGLIDMLQQGGDAIVLRWDKFGAAGDVRGKLEHALNNKVRGVKVKFMSEERCPCNDEMETECLDSAEQIEAAYEEMINGAETESQNSSATHLYIRYNMCFSDNNVRDMQPRTNQFKRVVMDRLSQGKTVVFYAPKKWFLKNTTYDMDEVVDSDSSYGESPASSPDKP